MCEELQRFEGCHQAYTTITLVVGEFADHSTALHALREIQTRAPGFKCDLRQGLADLPVITAPRVRVAGLPTYKTYSAGDETLDTKTPYEKGGGDAPGQVLQQLLDQALSQGDGVWIKLESNSIPHAKLSAARKICLTRYHAEVVLESTKAIMVKLSEDAHPDEPLQAVAERLKLELGAPGLTCTIGSSSLVRITGPFSVHQQDDGYDSEGDTPPGFSSKVPVPAGQPPVPPPPDPQGNAHATAAAVQPERVGVVMRCTLAEPMLEEALLQTTRTMLTRGGGV
jgi:hypothetical protein